MLLGYSWEVNKKNIGGELPFYIAHPGTISVDVIGDWAD
jgi:hypothetical protein